MLKLSLALLLISLGSVSHAATKNDLNNQKIRNCVETVDSFLGAWADKSPQFGLNDKGQKCHVSLTVLPNGAEPKFLARLNYGPSRNYVASMEMVTSNGFYSYPGIVSIVKACSVQNGALEIRSNDHIPRTLTPRNPPFLDVIHKEYVKIVKGKNGRVKSVTMKNHHDKTTDVCFF